MDPAAVIRSLAQAARLADEGAFFETLSSVLANVLGADTILLAATDGKGGLELLAFEGEGEPPALGSDWLQAEESMLPGVGATDGAVVRVRRLNDLKDEPLGVLIVRYDRDGAGDLADEILDLAAMASTRRLELRRARELIRSMSVNDALTGLSNRVRFDDRLAIALATARRYERLLAVMYLNLDRFKVVNDSLGLSQGDRLLAAVAERLASSVRDADTVARIGGDEFCILLTEVAEPQAVLKVVQRIREAFARPFSLPGQEVFITVSIGVSLFPGDGTEANDLVRHANAAMVRAKEQRDHFQFYTSSLRSDPQAQFALESHLRKALEREEFRLFYQPQVDLRTGRLMGAEALIRWIHPELGQVPPLKFIPLAEETGLILPISEWVLKTACQQAVAWQEAGLPPIRMGVNLSGRQLKQPNFIVAAARLMTEAGIAPEYLDFELTESILMEQGGVTAETLEMLRRMGIHLSIDDFGTGYSSLSYLKRFPISSLKIDRSFIRDMGTSPEDEAIVKAILAMAHSLQLSVVAEGVENQAQLDFLTEHGCEVMQGYLVSPPVPSEEFVRFLAQPQLLAPAEERFRV
ncbi:MAG TPA: bifunctional diguanylate cyclase/phosphodiesterase [Stenomitos sp.]